MKIINEFIAGKMLPAAQANDENDFICYVFIFDACMPEQNSSNQCRECVWDLHVHRGGWDGNFSPLAGNDKDDASRFE